MAARSRTSSAATRPSGAFWSHRKAGWVRTDCPVELGVEKKLGITKEDIGTKISIEEYNRICRKEVMTYTERMGAADAPDGLLDRHEGPVHHL